MFFKTKKQKTYVIQKPEDEKKVMNGMGVVKVDDTILKYINIIAKKKVFWLNN